MARRSDISSGNGEFFKQDDVGAGLVLTIEGMKWRDFEQDGKTTQKRVFSFVEDHRLLVAGPTVWDQIAFGVRGEDPADADDEQWAGTVIELYKDPTIQFGGKLVGGIRVRKPRGPRGAPPAPTTQAAPPKSAPAAQTAQTAPSMSAPQRPLRRWGAAPERVELNLVKSKNEAWEWWMDHGVGDAEAFNNALDVHEHTRNIPEDQFTEADWNEIARACPPGEGR
jgi:hypothetical protein